MADNVRKVPCPVCRGASRWASDNPWRPFCSERCRQIDLGVWASEGYRVSAAAPDPDDDPPGPAFNPPSSAH